MVSDEPDEKVGDVFGSFVCRFRQTRPEPTRSSENNACSPGHTVPRARNRAMKAVKTMNACATRVRAQLQQDSQPRRLA